MLIEGSDCRRVLDDAWDALAFAEPGPRWFLCSGWYKGWIDTAAEVEGAEPLVIRLEEGGKLVGGLALQLASDAAGRRAVDPLSAPWADYHDAVGDPDDEAVVQGLARRLSQLASDKEALLRLTEVRPGGLLERVARRLGLSESPGSATSSVDLAQSDPWQVECARKKYRVQTRQLARLGPVSCHHHSSPQAVMRRLPAFIDLHRRQWQGRPDAVAAFSDPTVVRCFEAIADNLSRQGHIILTSLYVASQPVAMCFGFRHAGWYGYYRTTFDQSYHRVSPGHLMLHRMLADFSVDGVTVFDFMRGAYGYKAAYANVNQRNLVFGGDA